MVQEEEKARLRRQRTKEAITLAMESRWEEAVAANQLIIDNFSTDIDAHNRKGRGLMELGRYAEAKEAYRRALELDPNNSIAQKNLNRLALLKEPYEVTKRDVHKVAPQIFVGEMGRVGVVTLRDLAPKEILAKMSAGDEVFPKIKGANMLLENNQGEYLGTVDPKHGLRLAKLMQNGNKYTAALASVDDTSVKVVIREIFRHPNQAGRQSFPVKEIAGFRPYLRESVIKHELTDEEDEGEEEEIGYTIEWEPEEAGEEPPMGEEVILSENLHPVEDIEGLAEEEEEEEE